VDICGAFFFASGGRVQFRGEAEAAIILSEGGSLLPLWLLVEIQTEGWGGGIPICSDDGIVQDLLL